MVDVFILWLVVFWGYFRFVSGFVCEVFWVSSLFCVWHKQCGCCFGLSLVCCFSSLYIM